MVGHWWHKETLYKGPWEDSDWHITLTSRCQWSYKWLHLYRILSRRDQFGGGVDRVDRISDRWPNFKTDWIKIAKFGRFGKGSGIRYFRGLDWMWVFLFLTTGTRRLYFFTIRFIYLMGLRWIIWPQALFVADGYATWEEVQKLAWKEKASRQMA